MHCNELKNMKKPLKYKTLIASNPATGTIEVLLLFNVSNGWCTACNSWMPGKAGKCEPQYGRDWGYCEPWCKVGKPYPSRMMEVQLDTLTDEEE